MHRIALAIAAIFGVFTIAPASAQVVITQAKALAGGITPGDSAGYPITLSQPGAYRLESNLSVPANLVGIAANNNNIDIDLNGFTISGNGVGSWGLASPYGQSQIHGGVIKSFRNSGIYLRGDAWTIADMKIVENRGIGVDATGKNLIKVQDSLISVNGRTGLVTGDIGYFRNNQIVSNGVSGIECYESCHVEGNLIDINKAHGIVTVSGMVTGNTIARNGLYGIFDFVGAADTGYANNTIVNNFPTGPSQVRNAVAVNLNNCIGKSCTVP